MILQKYIQYVIINKADFEVWSKGWNIFTSWGIPFSNMIHVTLSWVVKAEQYI